MGSLPAVDWGILILKLQATDLLKLRLAKALFITAFLFKGSISEPEI
jgi:hypothetical protein